jgi:hypothetical protein
LCSAIIIVIIIRIVAFSSSSSQYLRQEPIGRERGEGGQCLAGPAQPHSQGRRHKPA